MDFILLLLSLCIFFNFPIFCLLGSYRMRFSNKAFKNREFVLPLKDEEFEIIKKEYPFSRWVFFFGSLLFSGAGLSLLVTYSNLIVLLVFCLIWLVSTIKIYYKVNGINNMSSCFTYEIEATRINRIFNKEIDSKNNNIK